jgi:predicted anti-sigma-YlaC factor YlaD
MVCKKIRKELSSYLDNEVSLNKRVKIEKHLKGCTNCSYRLEQLKKIRTLTQKALGREPREGFFERLSPRLEEGEKRIGLKEKLFEWRYSWRLSLSPVGKMAVTISVLAIISLSFLYIWRFASLPEINIEVFQQEYVRYNGMSSFAEELALPVILEIK